MIEWITHNLGALIALWVFLIGWVWGWFWCAARLEELEKKDG